MSETKKTTKKLSPTNYSLQQTLIALVDLYDKIDGPSGHILYAINKNKTRLIVNGEEVEKTRISLLTESCKLGDNGKTLMKKQGVKDDKGDDVETAVWKDKDSEGKFYKEYHSLLNTENEGFEFFKIPLDKWLDIEIKKDTSPVVNIDYLVEYIVDEEK